MSSEETNIQKEAETQSKAEIERKIEIKNKDEIEDKPEIEDNEEPKGSLVWVPQKTTEEKKTTQATGGKTAKG